MIAGFTGTKKGMSALQLRFVTAILESGLVTTIVHGMCRGADAEVDAIAKRLGIIRIGYPADDSVAKHWRMDLDCDDIHSPRPPLVRNRTIVRLVQFVLAAPLGMKEKPRGSGTWATVRYARKAEVPVILLPR